MNKKCVSVWMCQTSYFLLKLKIITWFIIYASKWLKSWFSSYFNPLGSLEYCRDSTLFAAVYICDLGFRLLVLYGIHFPFSPYWSCVDVFCLNERHNCSFGGSCGWQVQRVLDGCLYLSSMFELILSSSFDNLKKVFCLLYAFFY